VGGGAANAAVTFARQGFSTALLAKIGSDQNGRAVLEDLKQEKVRSLVVVDKKPGTAYSVLLSSSIGERTALNYRGLSKTLKKEEIPFAKLKARWAYIAPGPIPFPVMKEIVKRLKKNKVKIAINPSKYYLEMGEKVLAPFLNQMDMVMVNREEAALLTGVEYHEEQKIFQKMDRIVEGIVIVTDGPEGVTVSNGERVFRAKTFPEKKLLDRTGSGDAFGSGFVSGLMLAEKMGIKDVSELMHFAICLASANATSVVEKIGAQAGILTKNEFLHSPRFRNFIVRERPALS
jgi:ribokinase